jgi:hypothetical protein
MSLQLSNVDDVRHVANIRARRMGPYTLVDLRVHVRSSAQACLPSILQNLDELLTTVLGACPNQHLDGPAGRSDLEASYPAMALRCSLTVRIP